jgi:hypothetical protein
LVSETYNTYICQESIGRIDSNFNVYFLMTLEPMSVNVIEIEEFDSREQCHKISDKCSSFVEAKRVSKEDNV